MATALAGAVMAAAPAAGAVELGAPLLPPVEAASAAFVEQVRSDLAEVGVATPPVDTQLTDALDLAIVDAVPGATLVEAPATGDEVPAEPVDTPVQALEPFALEESPAPGPNYTWRTDPVSKVMAGKPISDGVLHRVPGSWFDAPRVPAESLAAQERNASLFGPGTPIYLGENMMCTLGVVGTDAQGRKVGLTAGHCGRPGDAVASADSWQVGAVGTVVASNQLHDYSVIEFGSNAELSRSYNGVTVNRVGGPVAAGDLLCKQGVATGTTCGTTWSADQAVQISQVCAMVGDSGAPVLAGDRMVGMISGGMLPDQQLSCRTPLQGPLFMPTVSHSMDSVLADLDARGGVGAGFTLAG